MAIGIYKPGQGYWVRVLTAVGAGILVLATAAWLWQETAALYLPPAAWDVTFEELSGTPVAGQTVEILGRVSEEAEEATVLGTMQVESFTASEFRPQVRLVDPEMVEGVVPSDMQEVRAEGLTGTVAGSAGVRPIPVIDPLYVQGGVAAIVLLVGSVLVFWLVGARPGSSEFLIATDGEMKKVNWSTRREVLGSTWVVISASFLIAAALYVVDLAFQWFFVSIDVLQR